MIKYKIYRDNRIYAITDSIEYKDKFVQQRRFHYNYNVQRVKVLEDMYEDP